MRIISQHNLAKFHNKLALTVKGLTIRPPEESIFIMQKVEFSQTTRETKVDLKNRIV